MGINLWGYIYMLQAFLPGMVERGRGHVVNVASAAGLVGIAAETAYCASKFAVVGLSKGLYNELRGAGVTVTLVCPSYVKTPILRSSHLFGYHDGFAASLERWCMEPEEAVAEIAAAIDKNRFLVIPGSVGKLGYYAKRLSLRFYLEFSKLIYRNAQKCRV